MKRWPGTGRCRWMIALSDRSQKRFRLYGAVQLCAVRLYGRFWDDVRELSPQITNYLNHQEEGQSTEIRNRNARLQIAPRGTEETLSETTGSLSVRCNWRPFPPLLTR